MKGIRANLVEQSRLKVDWKLSKVKESLLDLSLLLPPTFTLDTLRKYSSSLINMASRLGHSSRLLRSTTSPSTFNNSRRSLFGFGGKKAKQTDKPKPLLSQDDLFHPLSQSPFKEMRAKGDRIKQLAYCPVSLEKYGEKKHVQFECPNCGFPTHASEARWNEDENHGRYWPRLREANEDEHDLRSGREMTEFKLPGTSSPRLARRALLTSSNNEQPNNLTKKLCPSEIGMYSFTLEDSLQSKLKDQDVTSANSSLTQCRSVQSYMKTLPIPFAINGCFLKVCGLSLVRNHLLLSLSFSRNKDLIRKSPSHSPSSIPSPSRTNVSRESWTSSRPRPNLYPWSASRILPSLPRPPTNLSSLPGNSPSPPLHRSRSSHPQYPSRFGTVLFSLRRTFLHSN